MYQKIGNIFLPIIHRISETMQGRTIVAMILMASCVRNICAKNLQNPLILLKVTIDNVGVPFLRHSVE